MKSLLILILLLTSQQGIAQPAKVRVRHEAQVAESNVYLGDIATIESTDPSHVRVLSDMLMGESPKAGGTEVWTSEDVSKRLRPYRQLLKDAKIEIPERLRISRIVTKVTKAELTSKIDEMLRATLPDSSWEVTLISADVPDEIQLPLGGSVQVVPLNQRPLGAAKFEILVYEKDQLKDRRWFNGRVKYTAEVAVLKRRIGGRTKIAPTEVTWQKKDLTFVFGIPANKLDLETATTAMGLEAGRVVLRQDLEREKAVKSGEPVKVVTGDQALSLSTSGMAKQSGFIGDVVKVVSMDRELSGKIVAVGVVRIQY